MLTRAPEEVSPLASPGADLLRVLRRALGARWEFTVSDTCIRIEHALRGAPYRRPRQTPTWEELLEGLASGFAAHGVPQDRCLPLRWGRETELTISAVQALDPLLKDGLPATYRSGYLPQPVVRLTGERGPAGDLRPGFLTSFVNVSRVQPIRGLHAYGAALDSWLSVLSRLGFHARHLSFHGSLSTWRRRQVEGITLHFDHAGLPLGDLVLLWNADNPDRMAIDLGTGLERLAWARTRADWNHLVFGRFVALAPARTLDALRTSTLLLAHGIPPAPRGAGSITRRLLATVDLEATRLGVSALARASYRYWQLLGELKVPWPAVVVAMEQELGV